MVDRFEKIMFDQHWSWMKNYSCEHLNRCTLMWCSLLDHLYKIIEVNIYVGNNMYNLLELLIPCRVWAWNTKLKSCKKTFCSKWQIMLYCGNVVLHRNFHLYDIQLPKPGKMVIHNLTLINTLYDYSLVTQLENWSAIFHLKTKKCLVVSPACDSCINWIK